MIVTTAQLFKHAYGKYAVGAYNINNAEQMSLEACFDGESMHHTRCSETEDHKEAATAFVEKRAAVFKGR